MAGKKHSGCASSRSMNVSQDTSQFNPCDEQGYIEPQCMFALREWEFYIYRFGGFSQFNDLCMNQYKKKSSVCTWWIITHMCWQCKYQSLQHHNPHTSIYHPKTDTRTTHINTPCTSCCQHQYVFVWLSWFDVNRLWNWHRASEALEYSLVYYS